jgi:ribosome-associated heat shock protein Hsp15
MHDPREARAPATSGADHPQPGPAALSEQRLDVWLDVACLFKTRSEAQKGCKGGKVEVNREPGNPHRQIRPGDEVRITRTHGKQIVVVCGLAEHHVPKALARELYRDVTPPPTPEETEVRRLERLVRPPRPLRRPDKRDRRALRRFKGF